ncbi:MAG: hypothetical protein II821_10685 [Treponema sp.]|nr:hypothetical protein [Treponema sp.]
MKKFFSPQILRESNDLFASLIDLIDSNYMRNLCHAGKSFVNLKNYRGDFMLFGLIAIVLIVVSAVVFSILGVAVDNLGDKCIEMIDRKK